MTVKKVKMFSCLSDFKAKESFILTTLFSFRRESVL